MESQPKPTVAKWLWIVLIIVVLAGAGVFWYFYSGPGKTETSAVTTPKSQTKKTDDKTAGWKTYEDKTIGYSLKYPSEFSFATDSIAFWKEDLSKGKLLINSFKISEYGQEKGLGPDLDQISDKNDIVNAIKNGTVLIVPGLKNEQVAIKKIGNHNFLRIFPGSAEGCFCYPINYVTTVGDYFVEISSFIRNKNIQNFDSEFAKDKNKLIKSMYGDIEAMLSTFQTAASSGENSATAGNATKQEICQKLYPTYKYSDTSINENFCKVEVLSGNYAEGVFGGSGAGAHWIANKVNNIWTKIQESQDTWDCAKLDEANFPKGLLTGSSSQCYNSTTKQTETW